MNTPPAKKVPESRSVRQRRVATAANTPDDFPVVGIGASAGGLEAIEELFRNMPIDTGMAFVLVQHLDPNHKSILAELVGRFTAMPVVEATQGVAVRPNHVYVIPPRRDLSLLNGVLQLMEPTRERHLRLSVDYFFRALAQDRGARSICIVLSGAGSDGMQGLRAIKGEGGLALVQKLDTAAYDSMPRSAEATGMADAVLAPAEMGPWLAAVSRHTLPPTVAEEVLRAVEAGGESDRLFVLLRNHCGYDFSLYKEGTIGRRVERRMVVNQITSLSDYVSLLQRSTDELDRLWKDFLIRVTQFFRNPPAFAALEKKALPLLLGPLPAHHQPLRVWVPGCSTGEEAYTIAMLLQEQLTQAGSHRQVQIFATDIDEAALHTARQGIYPASIVADVPPRYLHRYFVQHEHGFQLSKELRALLVFARHDITRDAPFSRIDLVSCRNLLIYMQPQLQSRVLDTLTYALKRGGLLFLGNSESLTQHAHLYESVDKAAKIFRRLESATAEFRPMTQLARRLRFTVPELANVPDPEVRTLRQLTESTLLAECTPACVVIDTHDQILYVHGRTGAFLEPAVGRATMNVIQMAREGLRNELARTIRKAAASTSVQRRERLHVNAGDDSRLINLSVRPLKDSTMQGLLLITFEDIGPVRPPEFGTLSELPAGDESAARISWLEQELAATRIALQNTTENLETGTEELQSTVEELQSSNEELMTSQEELSSVNEELHTVNVELENKIQHLEQTSNDLQNLLLSTEIGTVFLDLDLRVRRFTPAIGKIFSLIETDVGRPLADIVHKLQYTDLLADAAAVLDSLQPRAMEVSTQSGAVYSLRITLYRAGNNAIDGVVLTFVDLTERRLADQRFNELLELSPDAMLLANPAGQIVQINRHAEQLFGYEQSVLLGQPIETLIPSHLRARHIVQRRHYQRDPMTRPMGSEGLELIGVRRDGSEFPVEIAIGPIEAGTEKWLAAVVRDVSQQQRGRLALQRINVALSAFLDWSQERDTSVPSAGPALDALCRRLTEAGGYRQCWIGGYPAGRRGGLVRLAEAGFAPQGRGAAPEPAWLDPGRKSGPRVFRGHRAADWPIGLRERLADWGATAMLSVALMAQRRRTGVLAVFACEPDAFGAEEVQLWKNLAISLGRLLSTGAPSVPESDGLSEPDA